MQQRITRRTALALGALLPAAALSACSDEGAETPDTPAPDGTSSGTAGTEPEALHGVVLGDERDDVGDHLSVRVAQQWRPEPREPGPVGGGPGLRILQREDDDARPAPELGYVLPGPGMGEAAVRMPARPDVVEVLDAHELTEDAWPELADAGDRLDQGVRHPGRRRGADRRDRDRGGPRGRRHRSRPAGPGHARLAARQRHPRTAVHLGHGLAHQGLLTRRPPSGTAARPRLR